MARKSREEEGDKRPITATNLRKLLGIFQFVLPYKGTFAVGLIALTLSSATVLSFPFFAGKLLDVASGKTGFFLTTINQIALTLLGILVIQSFFSFIRVYTFSVVSERTLADIRLAVYQKIIWLPMAFFDNRRIGELLSRITSDVGTLQDTIHLHAGGIAPPVACIDHRRKRDFCADAETDVVHDPHFSAAGDWRPDLWKFYQEIIQENTRPAGFYEHNCRRDHAVHRCRKIIYK